MSALGRPRKYRWEEWFGRPRTILIRGVHYDCSQSTMATQVRNSASKRGIHVRVTDTGSEIVIENLRTNDAIPHTDQVAVVS